MTMSAQRTSAPATSRAPSALRFKVTLHLSLFQRLKQPERFGPGMLSRYGGEGGREQTRRPLPSPRTAMGPRGPPAVPFPPPPGQGGRTPPLTPAREGAGAA